MRRKRSNPPNNLTSRLGFPAFLVMAVLPVLVGAQERGTPTPAVYVREIHIDPILLAFDLDSAKLRYSVMTVLRNGGRLAEFDAARPALDVALTVPRTLTGVNPEPHVQLRIEVGRNLMEAGSSKSLVWDRTLDTPTYVTWRTLVAALEATVLNAVKRYAAPAGT